MLDQIDPAKLNGVLTALAEGVRGQGERIGQATTDANQVLLALNPARRRRSAQTGRRSRVSATPTALPPRTSSTMLDAASTTSATITDNAKPLDALLLNVIGLSSSGIALLGAEPAAT